MTKEQFDREKKYQAGCGLGDERREKGRLNGGGVLGMAAGFAAKFRPVLGGIFG